MANTPFARFFCPVPGRTFSRYGTGFISAGGYRADQVLGAAGADSVTAISHGEAAKYRREYDRAVAEGSLVEVDEAAYLAWQQESARLAKAAMHEQGKAVKLEHELSAARAAARANKAADHGGGDS